MNTLYTRIVVRNVNTAKNVQYILLSGFTLPLVQRTADTFDTIGFVNEYDADAAATKIAAIQMRSKATKVVDVTSENVLKKIDAAVLA